MAFNHKYNKEDSIQRACIVALINNLNGRITIENQWDDNTTKEVKVPFYYAMSGDERFLQDYFTSWSDCAPSFIEGNTDPIPRCSIWLTGSSVLSSNLTSRFVRGYYTKEENGELKRFNSYINSIPLQLNFSAEILYDVTIDGFKIVESLWENLYRTISFSVDYKGFRVPTMAGFPDNFSSTKQFEYTYGVTDRLKIPFEIEVQTYMPIIDKDEEMFAGNRIENIQATYKPDLGTGDELLIRFEAPIGLTGFTGASGGLGYIIQES